MVWPILSVADIVVSRIGDQLTVMLRYELTKRLVGEHGSSTHYETI